MKRRSAFLAILAFAFAHSTAFAHIPSIEPQAKYPLPLFAPSSADYSWSSPGTIDNVENSQAVFAYLTWGDVDVYKFTVTAEDLAMGPVIVAASALPPACLEYQWEYPVTALMGPQAPGPFGPPGLPAPTPDLDLPFNVPAGQGVVFADNPRVYWPEKREIFELPPGEGGFDWGDISWFLPEGLSQHCLEENQAECDFSNTIAQPVFYPGDYYLVIWNPTGIPTDYTANIGFNEANFEVDPDVVDDIADNGLLHRTCHEPYPFR